MNYIISYPRSGNTAFRYILELLTKMPTNGICGPVNERDVLQKPLLRKGSNFIAHKRHDFNGVGMLDLVFFIMRHPIEAVIRHNKGPRGLDNLKGHLDGWYSLLNEFDIHRNGIPIYYEELVKVAAKESKNIYPDPQTRSPGEHLKAITPKHYLELVEYIETHYPGLNRKYTKHYFA